MGGPLTFVAELAGGDIGAFGTREVSVSIVVPYLQVHALCFVHLVLDAEVFLICDPAYDIRLSFDVVQDVF